MLFKNLPDQVPFQLFEQYYQDAENNNQPIAEAGCISSVDKDGKPHSRFVNFKYFFEDNLIFFSSYSSNKAEDFKLIEIFSGLDRPWSLTFKNQNEILITEKSGQILLVNLNII